MQVNQYTVTHDSSLDSCACFFAPCPRTSKKAMGTGTIKSYPEESNLKGEVSSISFLHGRKDGQCSAAIDCEANLFGIAAGSVQHQRYVNA